MSFEKINSVWEKAKKEYQDSHRNNGGARNEDGLRPRAENLLENNDGNDKFVMEKMLNGKPNVKELWEKEQLTRAQAAIFLGLVSECSPEEAAAASRRMVAEFDPGRWSDRPEDLRRLAERIHDNAEIAGSFLKNRATSQS